MDIKENISFDKRMRAATKEIHSISDGLVNAKLALALSNNEVWSEGLLVFYEVFRFLEEAVDRNKNSVLNEVFIEDMRRTEAFEKDLEFYFGSEWKRTYSVRDSVASYLDHLRKIEETDHKLLLAYIYHLYMGLASGGQILRHKRSIAKKFSLNSNESGGGTNVTDFGSIPVSSLKRQMKDNINAVAEKMTEEDRIKLIEESKTVFLLNNKIVRSVKSADQIFRRKAMLLIFIIIVLISLFLAVRG